MNWIEKLKNKSLLEFIQKTLWQNGKKDNQWFWFKSWDEKTASLVVYNDNTRGYCDFTDKLWAGTIIDFYMNFYKCDQKIAIKNLCEIFKITSEKKVFEKQPKRSELVDNFEKYKLISVEPLSRFLQKRWFSFEQIKNNFENIEKLSKEIWFFEWLFLEKWVYKDTLFFPCYDENEELKGLKLRTLDLTKFKNNEWSEIKSLAIKSTWLIYKKEELSKQIIIVEGEIDYITLKALWFTSVIWNLWWVSSWMEKIKILTKEADEVISFYDNDEAWQQANHKLEKELNRKIKIIKYPTKDKVDVNDLFCRGFSKKEDFQKMIDEAVFLEEKSENEIQKVEQKLFKKRFFYNDLKMLFCDIKEMKYYNTNSIADYLFLWKKEVQELRKSWDIPTYDWVCYYYWWRPWMYNLLDDSSFLHPSDTPEVDENILFLISNLCNNNDENIEWLLKAIIYKYNNINDVYIPAVIFQWVGWTGKWLFIKLLSTIFWEKNTLIWLKQDNLDSRFSAYAWQKLIVEFKEIWVDNIQKWKRNTWNLKSIIMEEKIQIERKSQDPIQIDNIAWFIMSSNESKPLQLDSSTLGNRRFSVIKTGWIIPKFSDWICGQKIAKAIENKEIVSNFLAFLQKNYWDVKSISALDNEDKRNLENISESVWNLFFERIEEKYPNINKITNHERDYLLDEYRIVISENEYNDERYYIRHLNAWLSMKYKICRILIRWKQERGYYIDKEVAWDWSFPEHFFNSPAKKIPWII